MTLARLAGAALLAAALVKTFEVTIRLLGGLLAGHQLTGDPKLLAFPSVLVLDGNLDRAKRLQESGFAAIKDVRTMEKTDAMESFLFAETLKYLYLLFAPDSAFDLDAHVLTTEAHPLKRVSPTR